MAPAMIGFQASSLSLTLTKAQSQALNIPDQTAKFPAKIGALDFTAETIPVILAELNYCVPFC
jgi:hypothetical protein